MLTRYHADGDDATFALLPAIDLLGGRVVRLAQGDFARETVYGDDPAEVAAAFARQGARWLHVVDLDGARDGEPRHGESIRAIVARIAPQVRVEVAGGLRTAEAVDIALTAGASRAVVGTAALRDPEFAAALVQRHGPGRLAVAIDVRDGLALGDGWRPGAQGLTVTDAVERLADAGVTTFEVTAIDRDGLLGGPDLDLLGLVVRLGRGEVLASGGVGTIEDLLAIRDLGCRGAIVGRALYEGRFTIEQALGALSA